MLGSCFFGLQEFELASVSIAWHLTLKDPERENLGVGPGLGLICWGICLILIFKILQAFVGFLWRFDQIQDLLIEGLCSWCFGEFFCLNRVFCRSL